MTMKQLERLKRLRFLPILLLAFIYVFVIFFIFVVFVGVDPYQNHGIRNFLTILSVPYVLAGLFAAITFGAAQSKRYGVISGLYFGLLALVLVLIHFSHMRVVTSIQFVLWLVLSPFLNIGYLFPTLFSHIWGIHVFIIGVTVLHYLLYFVFWKIASKMGKHS